MDKSIKKLYNDYRDGKLSRRKFMKQVALLAGGTTATLSLMPLLGACKPAESTGELVTEMITYPGHSGDMMAFLAKPAGKKKFPAVIVIHENRGLQPHIKDVTRRMAAEGFLALAPDANSPLGGTPQDDENKGREMMRELDAEATEKDFVAAVDYLKNRPDTNGKVGCTGFCWGGGMTNAVAVNSPDLVAAVPYYGRQPDPADVPKIKAAVLAHYAGDDPRINEGIEAFEKAMTEAGIEHTIYMYEGAGHAFNNDSNPERYHPEAAKLAWERTIRFFSEKLK